MYIKGIENVYTDVDFKYTHFVSLYSKHTPFSTQLLNCKPERFLSLNPGSQDGEVMEFIVPRKGDLLKTIYLQMKVVPPSDSSIRLVNPFPYYMFRYFELYIGGMLIERLYPDMIQTMFTLMHTDEQSDKFTDFCGSLFVSDDTGEGDLRRRYFAPLPFYFFRNTSLSLPLCAFPDNSEVKVVARLRGKERLVTSSDFTGIDLSEFQFEDFTLPVEYCFVGDDEIRYFQSQELVYPINQTQSFVRKIPSGSATVQHQMRFINPVREFYFLIIDENILRTDGTDSIRNNYINRHNSEKTIGPGRGHHLDNLTLEFDGETILRPEVANYMFLNQTQTVLNHFNPLDPSITSKKSAFLYNYSLALDPENIVTPTGSINMSRINRQIIRMNLFNYSSDRQMIIYARSTNILRIKDGVGYLLFENAAYNNEMY